jgi:hypothetical protein
MRPFGLFERNMLTALVVFKLVHKVSASCMLDGLLPA